MRWEDSFNHLARCLGCAMHVPLLIALTLYGCGDTSMPPAPTDIPSTCKLAAISSDYSSTSVAILGPDGVLCADAVLHSGSRAPGTVTALSGDVVLPSQPNPGGELVLIDRYPNAALSRLRADNGTLVAQVGLGADFGANPQDIVFPSRALAYVSRHRANPDPSPTLDDYDEGSDLLMIDMTEGAVIGRIGLSEQADEGFDPMPSQTLTAADGRVWVGLTHLSRDFGQGGPGRLVAIDPARHEVETSVTLDGLKNCGSGLSLSPERTGLWVTCTGVFAEGPEAQLNASALVYVDLTPAEEVWRLPAGPKTEGQAFGFAAAAVDDHRALAVLFGALQEGTPDRLVLVDRRDDSVSLTGLESEAFQLGAPVRDETLWLIPDASLTNPRLRRFRLEATQAIETSAVIVEPRLGLPLRQVAHFR